MASSINSNSPWANFIKAIILVVAAVVIISLIPKILGFIIAGITVVVIGGLIYGVLKVLK